MTVSHEPFYASTNPYFFKLYYKFFSLSFGDFLPMLKKINATSHVESRLYSQETIVFNLHCKMYSKGEQCNVPQKKC